MESPSSAKKRKKCMTRERVRRWRQKNKFKTIQVTVKSHDELRMIGEKENLNDREVISLLLDRYNQSESQEARNPMTSTPSMAASSISPGTPSSMCISSLPFFNSPRVPRCRSVPKKDRQQPADDKGGCSSSAQESDVMSGVERLSDKDTLSDTAQHPANSIKSSQDHATSTADVVKETQEISELDISVDYIEKDGYIYTREEIVVDEEDKIWHPSYRQNRDLLKTLQPIGEVELVFGGEEGEDGEEEQQEELQEVQQETEKSVRGLHHKTRKPKDAAEANMYLITEAMLVELAKKGNCPHCHQEVNVQIAKVGTSAHLTLGCASGHHSRFCLQETVNGSHVGDIKFASAILLSGNNFYKIKRMADVMNLHMFDSKLFSAVQNHYVCPVVEETASSLIQATTEQLKDKEIVVCGDARNDSPGFCAQYCTYTLLDHATKEVVDVQFLDKRQAQDKSTTMEPMALIKALQRIKAAGLSVKELVTDAHPTISAMLRKDYPEIMHSWDVWHGAKNIGKKISKASKLVSQRPLQFWTKHIANHFWFCADTCKGNPDLFLSKWRGLVHHVTDKHEWSITGGLGGVPHCEHGELDTAEREEWLHSGTKAHDTLVKIVLDKRFLKTLVHYVNFRHTGELESLHNHILMYCGKRFAFGYRAYRARNLLAVIDYSKHKDRAIAVDKDGNVKLKAKWSKHASDWVVHEVRVGKSYSYDVEMMEEIMHRRLHDRRPLYRSPDPIPDDPAVIRPRLAPVPPPSKEELVERRKSRFST